MKFNINKKWLYAAALFGGIALAGMGAYSAYTSEDEVAAVGNGEVAQAANGVNAAANESAGVLDKLQAWTSGWGFTPFGGGKGADNEPAPVRGGRPVSNAKDYEISIVFQVAPQHPPSVCSGLVVAPYVILTAASCLGSPTHLEVLRVGGEFIPKYRCSQESCVNYFNKSIYAIRNMAGEIAGAGSVDKLVVSPKFRQFRMHDSDNDIGLIIMKQPLILNEYAKLDDTRDNDQQILSRIAGYDLGDGTYSGAGRLLNEAFGSTTKATYYDSIWQDTPRHFALNTWYFDVLNSHFFATNLNGLHTQLSDIGGGISFNSGQGAERRYYGIHSFVLDEFNKMNNENMSLSFYNIINILSIDRGIYHGVNTAANTPKRYALFSPLSKNRKLLDGLMKKESTPARDLTEKGCYLQWPGIVKDPKTGRCIDKDMRAEAQSDKGNLIADSDNNSGLGNIPMQCTLEDLQRMVEWNRTHSTAYLRSQATESWDLRFRHMYSERIAAARSAGSSMGISDETISMGVTAQIVALIGPKPDTSHIRGTQIDVSHCLDSAFNFVVDYEDHFANKSCMKKYTDWRTKMLLGRDVPRATQSQINNYIASANSSRVTSTLQSTTNYNTSRRLSYEFAAMNPECAVKLTRREQELWDGWVLSGLGSIIFDLNAFWDWLLDFKLEWQSYNSNSNNASPNSNITVTIEGAVPTDGRTSGTRNYNVTWGSSNGQRYNVNCSIPQSSWSAGSNAIAAYARANCMPP